MLTDAMKRDGMTKKEAFIDFIEPWIRCSVRIITEFLIMCGYLCDIIKTNSKISSFPFSAHQLETLKNMLNQNEHGLQTTAFQIMDKNLTSTS